MTGYGLWSVLPPIVAITLALKTKNVMVSLFLSLLAGALILSGGNPLEAFPRILRDFIYVQAADPANAQSLTNMLIIGAFIAVITRSGGAVAFATRMSSVINTRAKVEVAAWASGLLLFFSDTANPLIIGPIFQSICDRFKVSREKFAYILDCTAGPVCVLVPIVSWGVFVMALLDKEFAAASFDAMNSWQAIVGAIPYQFYAVLTLLMCGTLGLTGWEYGPMLDAQRRVAAGKLLGDGAVPLRPDDPVEIPEGKEPRLAAMTWPLLLMLTVMFTYFSTKGFPFEPMDSVSIRVGIGLGFFFGAILSATLSIRFGIMDYTKVEKAFFGGMSGMVYLCVLMIFAWGLGAACKDLGTASYIMQKCNRFISPTMIPLIMYISGCGMSLATGSAWGTYAILLPIGVPLAFEMGAPILVTIAAVLNGGLFGNHVSPISDTNILSSMGAACDHVDHFRTQWVYALDCALVCGALYAVAGITEEAWIVGPGAVLVLLIVHLRHRRALLRRPRG